MITGKKFRIYPSGDQAKTLLQWIGHQRFIYNAKVQEDRYFRKFAHKALSLVGEQVPCDQQYSQFKTEETAFLKEVPSQILRNGAYRWMSAQQRFFKKLSGRPAIKKKSGRQSVMITRELFRFERIDAKTANIHLGTDRRSIGSVLVKTHKDYEIPNSIYISVHGGQWHVSFSNKGKTESASEAELLKILQYLPEGQLMDVSTGFDRGVAVPVVSSDGRYYDYSEAQKKSFDQSIKGKKKWQRRFARRSKGSANRRKATARIGVYDRKIADIRNDFAHKTSKTIVDAPGSLLVFEDLKIKNMTASAKGTLEEPGKNVRQKAGLNKAILHSCWGRIKTYARYKGLKQNKLTVLIKAAYSSQECSRCGCTNKDNRVTQSEFICQDCGFICHADENASLVIKKRGVRDVLGDNIVIKEPKKIRFTKESIAKEANPSTRRAGAVRTDANKPVSTPVERVLAVAALKPLRSSRLKQETPTKTAIAV